MAGKPWSGQELEILRKMAGAGKTHREIGQVLTGRSRCAIFDRAGREGLSLAGDSPGIDFEAFKRIMKESRTPKCV